MKASDPEMVRRVQLGPARLAEARPIARLSRDLIEYGLHWTWTPERVAAGIRCPDTVVLAARERGRMVGFGIMHYLEEDAALHLLGVQRSHQRHGIGRRLVEWLEQSAMVAGIAAVHLEARAANQGARSFYRRLGYRETALLPLYYCGREAAVRMSHELRERWREPPRLGTGG